ncbi:MAG: hypothetical protein ACU0CI_12795 [Shimia sp.]
MLNTSSQGYGIRWFVLILLLLLAGCNTPSREFLDAPAERIVIGGAEYTVWFQPERRLAQALRTSSEVRFREDAEMRFMRAIQRVTGCLIRPNGMAGDYVMVTAKVACGTDPMTPYDARLVEYGPIRCEMFTGWSGRPETCPN